jgi:hypothetical protein
MSELTYAQEAVLNGDEFDVDELFAGLVRMGALGDVANPTLYLPPASEQRQGSASPRGSTSWRRSLGGSRARTASTSVATRRTARTSSASRRG